MAGRRRRRRGERKREVEARNSRTPLTLRERKKKVYSVVNGVYLFVLFSERFVHSKAKAFHTVISSLLSFPAIKW